MFYESGESPVRKRITDGLVQASESASPGGLDEQFSTHTQLAQKAREGGPFFEPLYCLPPPDAVNRRQKSRLAGQKNIAGLRLSAQADARRQAVKDLL